MRIVAPFASSTSLPQLSQTSTVFRATFSSFASTLPPQDDSQSRTETTQRRASRLYVPSEGAGGEPVLPDAGRYLWRRRRANGGVDNRRSFSSRDTDRQQPG